MKPYLTILVLAASCASGQRPEQPAVISLLGIEARLETWEAQATVDFHLHPGGGLACPTISLLRDMAARTLPDTRGTVAADTLYTLLEDTVARTAGPAYGGPGRLALALRRMSPETGAIEEALVLSVPRPGEKEETWEAPNLEAGYHRPPSTLQGRLERGQVTVRRLAPGRYEFALFLVLRFSSGDCLQAVSRGEAGILHKR